MRDVFCTHVRCFCILRGGALALTPFGAVLVAMAFRFRPGYCLSRPRSSFCSWKLSRHDDRDCFYQRMGKWFCHFCNILVPLCKVNLRYYSPSKLQLYRLKSLSALLTVNLEIYSLLKCCSILDGLDQNFKTVLRHQCII